MTQKSGAVLVNYILEESQHVYVSLFLSSHFLSLTEYLIANFIRTFDLFMVTNANKTSLQTTYFLIVQLSEHALRWAMWFWNLLAIWAKLIVLEFTLMVCWDGSQMFTVDICFDFST